MTIPQELQSTVSEPALIVALSGHDGVWWKADNGTLTELNRIHTDNPRYSDREGHFKTASGGKTMRAGAVYEDNKQEVLHEHLVETEKSLRPDLAAMEWREAWIFAPAPIAGEVHKRLKPLFRRITSAHLIKRNVAHTEPLDLLRRIREHREANRSSNDAATLTLEAEKLLHTTDETPGR